MRIVQNRSWLKWLLGVLALGAVAFFCIWPIYLHERGLQFAEENDCRLVLETAIPCRVDGVDYGEMVYRYVYGGGIFKQFVILGVLPILFILFLYFIGHQIRRQITRRLVDKAGRQ